MTARERLLDDAKKVVSTHRQKQYGPPEDLFEKIAGLLNTQFNTTFATEDVATIMILLKVARLGDAQTVADRDTWLDIAGYAACGYECVEKAELGDDDGDDVDTPDPDSLRHFYRDKDGDVWELVHADGYDATYPMTSTRSTLRLFIQDGEWVDDLDVRPFAGVANSWGPLVWVRREEVLG